MLIALPAVVGRQDATDLRVVQIRGAKVADLRLRRVEPQLVHEAIPNRVVAARPVPDASVPHVHGPRRAGRPELAAHVVVNGDLPGAHIAELRSRHQESTAHLVCCIRGGTAIAGYRSNGRGSR